MNVSVHMVKVYLGVFVSCAYVLCVSVSVCMHISVCVCVCVCTAAQMFLEGRELMRMTHPQRRPKGQSLQ